MRQDRPEHGSGPTVTAAPAVNVAPGGSRPASGDRRRAEPFLPQTTLPKGGGAVRGMGEKVSMNPARGSASIAVPVPVSAGRGAATPEVTLGYDAAAGNSPFGLGWNLPISSVARRTEHGLPRYDGTDTYMMDGAEELVPARTLVGGSWQADVTDEEIDGVGFRVTRYRPRVEGGFALIERCERPGETFWRVTTRDNVRQLYGRSGAGRIADPDDPRRVFRWLLEETRDDRGNVTVYEYAAEDRAGVEATASWERHRIAGPNPPAQRYLKRIRYGGDAATGAAHLIVVLDYGDHDQAAPTPVPDRPWPARPDPFSDYRAGFEVRTWRLCRRILMFHDFPADLLGPGPLPRLVRSTELSHDPDRAGARLVAVVQAGQIFHDGAYQTESMPPLEFDYTRSAPDAAVRVADAGTVANLPAGVDDDRYHWVDLDGDGVPGALTAHAGGWFYKRNLGAGRLGPLQRLPAQPGTDDTTPFLMDVAGDGGPALVRHGPVLYGYTERTDDGGWGPFTPFASVPTLDWADPSLHQLDLDGDGLADLVLTDAGELRWHRNLGRDGFGSRRRTLLDQDEELAPVPARTGTEALLLADMSGDGLTDLVRVRDGEVCYWPNLGHGRFGAKVVMAHPPRFDHPDQFDPDRVRGADLDGSGATDLIYVGRGEVTLWRNESGNSFGAGEPLAAVPPTDRAEAVSVVDLFGTGTACLVWSSPKPADGRAPLRYIDLCRAVSDWLPGDDPGWTGHKANLLCEVRNNLGARTRLVHAPSTRFSLADRAAGRPWATRLPFPVQVVTRMESFDDISRTRTVTSYAYRHGYYDRGEREFRGFGMVEQFDAERFDGTLGAGLFAEPTLTESHRPPVRTRTWFHTGAPGVQSQPRDEYYAGDPAAQPLDDHELPTALAAQHAQAAVRAMAGQPLRIEVFADDASSQAGHPYTVTEHRYRVAVVQPGFGTGHAVFRHHRLETLTYHYEREPADPRLGHELILDVDEFNTVRQQVAIGYPRRDPIEPEQAARYVLRGFVDVAHTVGPAVAHRLGTPLENRAYEVTGLPAPVGERYRLDELAAVLDLATVSHRLVERTRIGYWNDTLAAPLPWGEVGARALVHQTYQLVFTPDQVAEVYGDRVDATMLADEGRYVFAEGAWWIPSGVQRVDAGGFYLPVGLIDPFGNESTVEYDPYHLLPIATRQSSIAPYDTLVTRVSPDYRLLAPWQMTDPNGNRSRIATDALGRVTAVWVNGKEGESDGDPDGLPGHAYSYDAWSWHAGTGPASASAQVRERHGEASVSRSRAFCDGAGRVVMTKTQAEPGSAWTIAADGEPVLVSTATRWTGSGRTVFDNKGLPVKQYEPYFSTTDAFEDADDLVRQGVTAVSHYDPVGRLVRTEFPDGTLSRVTLGAWRQESWDPNDTVLESRWYADRGSPDPATEPEPTDSERRAAWLAAHHAATPALSHLDSLGRVVLSVADNGQLGPYATRTEIDLEGNTRSVTDARGVVVLRQDVDTAGRVLHTVSSDAGERWILPDAHGTPVRSWDSRGFVHRREFDPLRRPVATWVSTSQPGPAGELLTELTWYGEAHPQAAARNLRGRLYLAFDGAGLATTLQVDFKGNVHTSRRRLATVFQAAPDWAPLAGLDLTDAEAAAMSMLETEVFATTTDHDALNRPALQVLPDTTVLEHGYNQAGLLETVTVRLPGQPAAQPYVSGLDYDARGQRLLIVYGNGVRTVSTYDPWNLRLRRLETVRGAAEHLQDLRYTYDPGGNLVEIRDEAQQTVFFAGQVVAAASRYRYDALSRLVEATGREQVSLGQQPDAADPTGAPLPHPNDVQALRGYRQRYDYDAVGNILALTHQAGPAGSWTRDYTYAADSNRLLAHTRPDPQSPATFQHDAHGNLTAMPSLSSLGWDHADRLSTVDLGGGGTAHYTYDASGRRVRKVLLRLGGLVEERVYLGGLESHRRSLNGTLTFQRDTVHVLDDTRRIALIETKLVDEATAGPAGPARIRYQLGNHLGSAVLEVDGTAAVITYEEYHPYGTTAVTLAAGAVEVSARRYRYTGKEKDEETGLYYHGARYYACWLGRWTSPDPIGIAQHVNGFLYALDNPIRHTDPTGRDVLLEDELGREIRVRGVPGGFVVVSAPNQIANKAEEHALNYELSGDPKYIELAVDEAKRLKLSRREAEFHLAWAGTTVEKRPIWLAGEIAMAFVLSLGSGSPTRSLKGPSTSPTPSRTGPAPGGAPTPPAGAQYEQAKPSPAKPAKPAEAKPSPAAPDRAGAARASSPPPAPPAPAAPPAAGPPPPTAKELSEALVVEAAKAGVAPGHLRRNPVEVLIAGGETTVATVSPRIHKVLVEAGIEARHGVRLVPPQPKRISIVLGTPTRDTVHGGDLLFEDLVNRYGTGAAKQVGETASTPIPICDTCSMRWDLLPGIRQTTPKK